MPPAGALWVVLRPTGTAGRVGRLRSRTRRASTTRRVSCSPVSPAQLRPERPTVPWKCGHHDQGGSSAILLWPPTGGRLVCCLTFSPGLAVEPAGPSWGTCNRIVPAARSGGGLRPLVNPGRRLGQSRAQCDPHRGQPVAGVLARDCAHQPRGLCARRPPAAGAENWSGRRGCLPRRRWAWVAGPVSSAPRLRLRLSATASVRRRCRSRRRRCSRWSPATRW